MIKHVFVGESIHLTLLKMCNYALWSQAPIEHYAPYILGFPTFWVYSILSIFACQD